MSEKFKVSKWIFLSLAILSNAFLIFYSCLSMETTVSWNKFVTNIFASLTNSATKKEVVEVPMTSLEVSLSNEETYKYNYIPGYQPNEIPLGSSKQLEATYLPNDTTDTSVEFYSLEPEKVKLTQSGSIVSVVGMVEGKTKIHVKNKLSGLDSEFEVNIVNIVAPESYEISVPEEIQIGSPKDIVFDIDGGYLGHNELINFRYYDIRKLSYESENTAVCEVINGVVYPKGVGSTKVIVSNENGFSKSVNVNVVSGVAPSSYDNLVIEGSSVCYDNDMIKDQTSGKNHYQLEIKNGEETLDPNDFIWESSNELLVKVDSHGVMRGFRKKILADESATITATSKKTGDSATFEVTVKEQLPETMYYWVTYGKKDEWAPKEFTFCNGDSITIQVRLNPSVSNKSVVISDFDENLVQVTVQGSSINIHAIAIGNTSISFYSEVNPSLTVTIDLSILNAGAIDKDNINDVGYSLRKVLGHAFVFAVAQVFTIIAIYMFLYKKPLWLLSIFSLSISLIISSISEFIERFIPGRSGTFIDVLIDMAGVVVGFAVVLAVLLIKRAKDKKKSN